MNMNILLVDDEAVDLEWLRRRVLACNLSLRVAGTANSGFAALKMMEQERIDIILSDIRMPIMSGIEFARQAKAVNPLVNIVFISGHEDFGYAKEAIQINASGYLLKPVEDSELQDMLVSICSKVREEREKNRSVTDALTLVNQELLLRWLNDSAGSQIESHIRNFLLPLLHNGCAVAVMETDDLAWKAQELSEDERRILSNNITHFIRQTVEHQNLGTFLASHSSRYVLLTAVGEHSFVANLEELVQAVAKNFPLTITIGTGMYSNDVEQLQESYRQAHAALNSKWLLGKNRVIRDVSKDARSGALDSNFEEVVRSMLHAIMQYDLVAIDDCLLKLFRRDLLLSRKSEVYHLIIRVTAQLHADLQQMNEDLYDILKWDTHQPVVLFQFETMDDILSWLRRRFFELSELLYRKKQKQKRKLIEEIMRNVEERLESKITLKEVASHFSFTPNYLGHLFKEETGYHFTDYLIEQRMKHVCLLLSDPMLKIYQIAERVGYKNIIYFNRQFKQSTGMTPGEYRKKHRI